MPGLMAGPATKTDDPPLAVAVIFDGMHNKVVRSNTDPDWNKKLDSGRKKTSTYNTMIMVDSSGRIFWISPTVSESTYDLTLLREKLPEVGSLTAAMRDPNTPEGSRPVIVADKGFQGLERTLPGAYIYAQYKRHRGSDPETGRLTQMGRDRNAKISRARMVVEYSQPKCDAQIGSGSRFMRCLRQMILQLRVDGVAYCAQLG